MSRPARPLIVCAVEAERAAAALPGVAPVCVGAGPAAAAAGTAAELARYPYPAVILVGIGGGFAPLGPGDIAVAARCAFADFGAQTADAGFTPAGELGFAVDSYDPDPQLAVELADRTGGRLGTVLTVATVTGTAARADVLLGRYPDAVAEGMEGAGVAAAAALFGTRFAEVRAISNVVGPRDRAAWRIDDALAALHRAVAAIVYEEPR